jgi:hypothetical protein
LRTSNAKRLTSFGATNHLLYRPNCCGERRTPQPLCLGPAQRLDLRPRVPRPFRSYAGSADRYQVCGGPMLPSPGLRAEARAALAWGGKAGSPIEQESGSWVSSYHRRAKRSHGSTMIETYDIPSDGVLAYGPPVKKESPGQRASVSKYWLTRRERSGAFTGGNARLAREDLWMRQYDRPSEVSRYIMAIESGGSENARNSQQRPKIVVDDGNSFHAMSAAGMHLVR